MSGPPAAVGRLAAALPGLTAERVAPWRTGPADGGARPAAVLVLLAPSGTARDGGGEVDVALVERAAGPGAHGGQVALPGGGVDPGDASVEAAALREAREETGLDDAAVVVLGRLPALPVPVSRYLVTPVVAWQPVPTALRVVDAGEIAAVHRVPLAALADPGHRVRVALPAGRSPAPSPGFVLGDLFVWGFTALVLDVVLRLAGLERPWAGDRVLEPPARVGGPR